MKKEEILLQFNKHSCLRYRMKWLESQLEMLNQNSSVFQAQIYEYEKELVQTYKEQAKIEELLNLLTDTTARNVLILYYFDEKKTAEIALRLFLSKSTVRRYRRKALSEIEKITEEMDGIK